VPLINAVLCCLLGTGFWHGYMQGGLAAAILCTAISFWAKLTICVHDVKHSHAQKALRHIYHVLDKHKMFPGILRYRYDIFRTHFEKVAEPPLGCAGFKLWSRFVRDGWRAFKFLCSGIVPFMRLPESRLVVVTILGWTLTSVLSLRGLPVVLSALAMMLTVAMLSFKMTVQFPSVAGPFYNIVLIFFLCVAMGMEAGTAFSISVQHVTPLMTSPRSGGSGARVAREGQLPSVWLGNSSGIVPYAVCQMEWGSKDALLSCLDLAALSWMAYEPDCNAISGLLGRTFGQLGRPMPRMEQCAKYDALPRYVSFYFPPERTNGIGTRVWALKGTSTWRDIYTDTKLFSTIHVLQVFSSVVPILSLLPLNLVQSIVGAVSLRRGERRLWEDLEKVVREQQAVSKGRERVLLTGHSLGGGIAQIVAARMQLPALVFSSPGIVYSARRFGLSEEQQARHVVVVMPDHDVVPRVDRHAGVVQHIACRGRDGLHASAGSCHSLDKTACELWRVCGDRLGRDFSETCAPYVALSALSAPRVLSEPEAER